MSLFSPLLRAARATATCLCRPWCTRPPTGRPGARGVDPRPSSTPLLVRAPSFFAASAAARDDAAVHARRCTRGGLFCACISRRALRPASRRQTQTLRGHGAATARRPRKPTILSSSQRRRAQCGCSGPGRVGSNRVAALPRQCGIELNLSDLSSPNCPYTEVHRSLQADMSNQMSTARPTCTGHAGASAQGAHFTNEIEYEPVFGSLSILKLSVDSPNLPRIMLPRSLALPARARAPSRPLGRHQQ